MMHELIATTAMTAIIFHRENFGGLCLYRFRGYFAMGFKSTGTRSSLQVCAGVTEVAAARPKGVRNTKWPKPSRK